MKIFGIILLIGGAVIAYYLFQAASQTNQAITNAGQLPANLGGSIGSGFQNFFNNLLGSANSSPAASTGGNGITGDSNPTSVADNSGGSTDSLGDLAGDSGGEEDTFA